MNIKLIGIGVAVAVVVLLMVVYTVDQRQKAIMFRLGEIKRVDIEPGLHFKIPFIHRVEKYDGRILTLDAQPERFLTVEKKNVIVDFFVKWRIEDVAQYYRSTRGDEVRAQSRLAQIIKDGLRGEFGKRTIQEAVSGERTEIMNILRVNSNEVANELGIAVVDVRISRIDLPDEVSASVYRRMEAERGRVAADFRARGQEAAERIRANADRQRTIIRANAYRDAESVRGEGDATSADIYAKGYGRNEEFFTFSRSLNAYKNTFREGSSVLVIQPESEFFRYFNQSVRP